MKYELIPHLYICLLSASNCAWSPGSVKVGDWAGSTEAERSVVSS